MMIFGNYTQRTHTPGLLTTLQDPTITTDKENAINVSVHLMLMIDCADIDRYGKDYTIGGFKPVCRRDWERFAGFVNGECSRPRKSLSGHEVENALKGWKLKNRAHAKVLPIDNPAEHLLYDPQDSVVRIFHHTAFLKATSDCQLICLLMVR